MDDARLSVLSQPIAAADNCVFLGCTFGPRFAAVVTRHHALVFPSLPEKIYKPFRSSLYSVDELFDGYDPDVAGSYYSNSLDWKVYASYIKVDEHNKPLKPVQFVESGLDEILSRRLHDNFIDDELDEFLDEFRGPEKKGVVAIMGGHDKKRSDPDFKRVASVARSLTLDGYLIVTGGGPGFMEAAHVGAFFATRPEADLYAAIDKMAVPNVSDSFADPEWLKAAWLVRKDNLPTDWSVCRSLGIPTWFYGHEPPNVFASQIAKYFENSLREEGLLAIASNGVIFAEGNGGTIQEIFQDACQNYYENYDFKSPMVLFGKDYWQPKAIRLENGIPVYPEKSYPAWPLLEGIAQKKNFLDLLTLTSDADVVLNAIRRFKAPW